LRAFRREDAQLVARNRGHDETNARKHGRQRDDAATKKSCHGPHVARIGNDPPPLKGELREKSWEPSVRVQRGSATVQTRWAANMESGRGGIAARYARPLPVPAQWTNANTRTLVETAPTACTDT